MKPDLPRHPAELGSALSGRYTIERELGRGGNAVVYLAHDVKHDRKVALKVLLPELALSVRTERFFREIQIAAKLTHPHILALIDSGAAGEILYYVMPYVEGESLRDRLVREKQLPVDDALKITRDVAAALDYAHGQGVIHRDIKPENILLSHGEALVADFGIARALTAEGETGVTQSGVAVGTPAYMSPEQGSGGDVGPRSDTYSLGCVLYEMLAGHPPFAGTSAQEILARHALDPVPAVRAARPDVSAAVERVVITALAKVPAARFGMAASFGDALAAAHGAPVAVRRAATVTYAVVAAGLLAAAVGLAQWGGLQRGDGEASVGILPCVNLSTDVENDYFSEGIAEELISGLARVPGLRVPALTSALALKGSNLPMRQVAQRLEVAAVFECTVRRAGGRLKLGARLLDLEGSLLWSESFDRELTGVSDLIAVQEEIATAIVEALPSKLSLPQAFLAARHTLDTVAHDLYLRGAYFRRQRTPDGLSRAIVLFEQAIDLDTNFALAYAGVASAAVAAGASGYASRAPILGKARVAATRAVALNGNSAEAHAALAGVHYFADWNWQAAGQEYRLALELNPNLAEARSGYANLLAVLGRFDEAAREATLGRRADPLSSYVTAGGALSYARRHDDAIRELQRVLTIVPDDPSAHAMLGRAYVNAGRLAEAIPSLEKEHVLRGGTKGGGLGRLGYVYAKSGRRDDALRVLSGLLEEPGSANVWIGLAWVYLGLGNLDHAAQMFVAAVQGRDQNPSILADPALDPIRSDPRVQEARKRLGLDP